MKIKVALLASALTFGAVDIALAHPEHDHPAPRPAASEQTVRARAKEEVARLVEAKKVDGSWKGIAIKSLKKHTVDSGWEWLATFENAAATKDKILYVFLTPAGDFVAANFTGK